MANNSAFATGGGVDQKFNGAFRADDVHLDWTQGGVGVPIGPPNGGALAGTGALVQQAQWSCQRTVSFLYEIGSTNVYYVGNRRQGQAQFTRVVAGSQSFKNLVTTFGNLCRPQDLLLNAKQAACNQKDNAAAVEGGVQYTLKDATLTQVGGSVSANDIVVNEQLAFMFADLAYE